MFSLLKCHLLKLIGKTTYEALYVDQTRRILKKRKRIIKQKNHINTTVVLKIL